MTFTLHDVPLAERPRERLVKYGASALSMGELVALLLGTGTSSQPVMRTATSLLQRFPELRGLSEASLEDLQSEPSIGPAKACLLLACFELARRMSFEVTGSAVISSPREAAQAAREHIRDFYKEHTMVLSFDARNRLIKADEISVGILNASLVHPREVFGIAIKRHAASVMLCHNHPSGDIEPSADDIELTERLATAARIIGIPLLDHLIISENKHESLKELGFI